MVLALYEIWMQISHNLLKDHFLPELLGRHQWYYPALKIKNSPILKKRCCLGWYPVGHSWNSFLPVIGRQKQKQPICLYLLSPDDTAIRNASSKPLSSPVTDRLGQWDRDSIKHRRHMFKRLTSMFHYTNKSQKRPSQMAGYGLQLNIIPCFWSSYIQAVTCFTKILISIQ